MLILTFSAILESSNRESRLDNGEELKIAENLVKFEKIVKVDKFENTYGSVLDVPLTYQPYLWSKTNLVLSRIRFFTS